MISAKTKVQMTPRAVTARARWAAASPLQKAASMIARSAKASIRKSERKTSLPGEAPRTRGKKRSLKKSIMYHVDRQAGSAIIGPAAHVSGLTGHYHEAGGVQYIKGRRRSYKIGSYGPLRFKEGYITPRRKLKNSSLPVIEGVGFGKIKTPAARLRAQLIDRKAFPDVEKPRPRRYKQRPYMLPAVHKNQQTLIKMFANSI